MRDGVFIAGAWRRPIEDGFIEVFNPYTERVIDKVSAGGPQDVAAAVSAARSALPGWRSAGGIARARFLRAIAQELRARSQELARLSSLNNGKPLAEARTDMTDAAASFDYYADLAAELDSRQDKPVAVSDPAYRARLRFEPAGVAGLIVPWNFPLVTTSWKVAPALAAGCTTVLKPSEVTALVELELARIAIDVGLPPGVLNIVTGTGPDVGSPLTLHPDVAKISFTGSNGVGARVMAAAAAGPKSVGLELGGKSPIVVFADSDEARAAELIVNGIFYNAGQMCSATSRLIVERRAAERIVERVAELARGLKPGDPLDPATTLGPLTTRAQHDKVLNYIAEGKAGGLKLVSDGSKPADVEHGWFVAPTIFADVPPQSRLWREEIFGPVLCVQTFEREEEAVALANDSEFGLVATVVTEDSERAGRVADAIEAGLVWINSPQTIFVETSWGGVKASGIGRELGPWGLSAYLEVKHVTQWVGRGDKP
jgi:betaine-aldehyde dehydrogenase